MTLNEEYTLLQQLGAGGFATVYKARHNQLGYVRAIRMLNAFVPNEESEVYRKFLRECKVLLRLGNGNHPNIVHVYQPRLVDGHALVEMDYVDGMDLTHFIKQQGGFIPLDEVLRMVEEISSALAYCHHDIYHYCMDRKEDELKTDPDDGSKVLIDTKTEQRLVNKYKVIHNDIHSGNIMRRFDGHYTLLDFGLAIEGSDVVHSSRHENGAPEYKAPEKWDNDTVLTEQSDIYSFGIVMYEYLVGRVPFPFDKTVSNMTATFQVCEAHKNNKPESIFQLRKAAFAARYPGQVYDEDYPHWLEAIVMKCLAKDPAQRYKDGAQLHEAIEKGLAESREHFQMHSEDKTLDALREEVERLKQLLSSQDSRLQPDIPRPKPQNMAARTFTVKGVSFNMVHVKAGSFTMGATSEQEDPDSDEKPAHRVTLTSDYWMGATEVTQALWKAVMGSNPSEFKGDERPVECVSWEDCQDFIAKLNRITGKRFRLPTEAEWEYAARGGSKSRGYQYAGSNNLDEVAWYDRGVFKDLFTENRTHPVGQKQPNELGLYDMSGNVYEWCQDWYDDYSSGSQTNPTGPSSGSDRVLRGGSWNNGARYCRSSNRVNFTPDLRFSRSGFRLVLSEL
ncbi:MAG: bifunctional serine/threonine-protein kinase/formylglycine-generating enzyme family protein [Bacteroidales bacterium]|nr:bifunctional serine/threonine-protein kinase/formylglycine-generating enzyme family protein [Bacteroidales bacterium]